MSELLNQHSYLLAAMLILAVAGLVAWQVPSSLLRTVILGGALLLVAMAPLALRSGGSTLSSAEGVTVALDQGTPTLMEVYSDF